MLPLGSMFFLLKAATFKTCFFLRLNIPYRSKVVFDDQLSLNAGQKYCTMLQREPSAILST